MKHSYEEQIVREIHTGKGGAFVYELTGGRIAKHVVRADMPRGAAWDGYMKEARFYARQMQQPLPFVPEILCSKWAAREWAADEILIIMRKYRPLEKRSLARGALEKVMAVLAQIHALPLPEAEAPAKPQTLSKEEIARCHTGWSKVLAEHGDAFSQEKLDELAEAINRVNERWHSARRCCVHGDFHAENLLTDAAGNIIVCDWQNIGVGHPAGDIAFLLSRLAADGVQIDRTAAVDAYCRYAQGEITAGEIEAQMRLSNLNTSFVFWHHYLHGADKAAVRDIYEKMISDMEYLLLNMSGC